MLESKFQSELIKELEDMFHGCIVLKNDANYLQGFPDLTIFFEDKYAVLECKRSECDPHRPNQDYYIDMVNKMSYASFIYPENKEDVLDELQQAFKTRRSTCVPKCQ